MFPERGLAPGESLAELVYPADVRAGLYLIAALHGEKYVEAAAVMRLRCAPAGEPLGGVGDTRRLGQLRMSVADFHLQDGVWRGRGDDDMRERFSRASLLAEDCVAPGDVALNLFNRVRLRRWHGVACLQFEVEVEAALIEGSRLAPVVNTVSR